MARWGLRLRLSIAFVAVAALAVGLATLLSAQGLEPRLTDAAKARIARSADRLAVAAAARYRRDGRWTEAGVSDLEHVGLTTGLRLVVVRPDRRVVPTADSARMRDDALHGAGATSRPILVAARTVGTLHAAPVGGSLLSPADVNLRDSLDRLHMIAGGIAVAIALVAALLLAQTMTAPLRRIRSAAQRMERGDLDAEIEPGGDAEVRAVGHALNRLAETLKHEDRVRRESVADLAHELRTPVSGLLSRIEAAQGRRLRRPGREPRGDARRGAAATATARRPRPSRRRRAAGAPTGEAPARSGGRSRRRGQPDAGGVRGEGRGAGAGSLAMPVPRRSRPLAQIVANLLSNALRYTDPGGRVTLQVGATEGGAILAVADTGIGIDAEDLQHIFKRFWRADKSRSRATGGTGIGLAIVRELVVAHDGRIDVESEPGRGSCFRVSFPAGTRPDLHENGKRTSPDLQTSSRS